MSLELLFFFLLAFGILVTGLLVVLFRNPIYSAISLIGTFLCMSGLYALLNAPFLAVIQVMVYAGAIMVLFLFVIMLLNLSDDELGVGKFTVTKLISVATVAFIFVGLASGITTLRTSAPDDTRTAFPGLNRIASVPDAEDVARLGTVKVEVEPGEEAPKPLTLAERKALRSKLALWNDFGSIRAIGTLMFTRWLLIFEVTGVLLLAAVIGAVVIAKRRLT